MTLYHFTCDDHGAPGIMRDGLVRPAWHPLLDVWLAWFTDLDAPPADAIGLQRGGGLLTCDRTAVRFEVDAPGAVSWASWARAHRVRRVVRDALEGRGMPAHWFVSPAAVPVVAVDTTVHTR
jgi:hypothetical protein